MSSIFLISNWGNITCDLNSLNSDVANECLSRAGNTGWLNHTESWGFFRTGIWSMAVESNAVRATKIMQVPWRHRPGLSGEPATSGRTVCHTSCFRGYNQWATYLFGWSRIVWIPYSLEPYAPYQITFKVCLYCFLTMWPATKATWCLSFPTCKMEVSKDMWLVVTWHTVGGAYWLVLKWWLE